MEHNSLAYGVDWCRIDTTTKDSGISQKRTTDTLDAAMFKCDINDTSNSGSHSATLHTKSAESGSGEATSVSPTIEDDRTKVCEDIDLVQRTCDYNTEEFIASCSFYDHMLHLWKFQY